MNGIDAAVNQLKDKGLPQELIEKWQNLITGVQSLGSAVVAYSGGVDSTFLAHVCHLVLGDAMCAVFLKSEVMAEDETVRADQWAAFSGFNYARLTHTVLNDSSFVSNPVNRCYVCKVVVLARIHEFAKANGFRYVLEGQNADDQQDYRPGSAAVTESGTLSPLLEARLTKSEIRRLAQALSLPVWNQPSSPCLATRIPYGQAITAETLKRVYLAESYLHSLGLGELRVRAYPALANIEVPPDQRQTILEHAEQIQSYFKSIGFMKIALDLQGYRRGSMNEGAI